MNKAIIRILNTVCVAAIAFGTYEAFGPLVKAYADAPEPIITVTYITIKDDIIPEPTPVEALADVKVASEDLLLNASNVPVSSESEMIYVGDFLATAYCCEKYEHICGEGHGITKSGEPVKAELTVAADWDILPEGTWIYIEDVGIRQVQDIGGSIKNMRIDVAVDTHANALKWSGYGNHKVYILPNYESKNI